MAVFKVRSHRCNATSDPCRLTGMRELVHDLRDTWRGLRRDRLYAVAVVCTLGLTLGAAVAERYPTLPATPRHFEIWRDRATSFTSMAAMDWRTSTVTGAGDPAQVVV